MRVQTLVKHHKDSWKLLKQFFFYTLNRDETSDTDHTQKRRFRHGAMCRTIKALAILRCLYGSEMVLLGVVIRKCETPTTNISQENGPSWHPNDYMSNCGLQLETNSSGPILVFFLNLFDRNIIGFYLSILFLIWCKIVNILRRKY